MSMICMISMLQIMGWMTPLLQVIQSYMFVWNRLWKSYFVDMHHRLKKY